MPIFEALNFRVSGSILETLTAALHVPRGTGHADVQAWPTILHV